MPAWPRRCAAWRPRPEPAGSGSWSSRWRRTVRTRPTRRSCGPSMPTAWSSPGPGSTTRRSSSWSSDGFPIVLQGDLPDVVVPERGRRQRRRCTRRGRAPGRPRAPTGSRASPMPRSCTPPPRNGWPAITRRSRPPASRADPDLVIEGGFDASSGHRAMAELLARTGSGPRSWPATSSRWAPSGRCAPPACRCPDDVSIVGFDDIPLAAYFDPPLTTVRLPAFELGQAAGRALLDRIAEREIAARTLLRTELVIRSSTRAAAAAASPDGPDRDHPGNGPRGRGRTASPPGGGRSTATSAP